MSQELAAAVVSLEMFIPRSLRTCCHFPPTPVGITRISNTVFKVFFVQIKEMLENLFAATGEAGRDQACALPKVILFLRSLKLELG